MSGEHGGTEDECRLLPYNSQILPVHAATLRTGKLLIFSGSGNDPAKFPHHPMEARLWDPKKEGTPESLTRVEPHGSQTDLFCAGHTFLPDGRLLVAGGNARYLPIPVFTGLKDTFVFDPATNSWLRAEDMREGRWYPTCLALPDGRVLAVSGFRDRLLKIFWPPFGLMNKRTEVWSPQGGWAITAQTTAGRWTDLRANQAMDYYPRVHLLPGGDILRVGPEPETLRFDAATRRWPVVAKAGGGRRVWGTSVLLPLRPPGYDPRILIVGGSTGEYFFSLHGKTSAEILSRTREGSSWRYAWSWGKPLTFRRRHVNATILLDGRVLITGGARAGNEDPVLETELFDSRPTRDWWTLGATCSVGRVYHSVAALLPDGQVWTGGGNPSQGDDELRIELYTPGYCHDEDRPEIEEAPEDVTYGGAFTAKVRCPTPAVEFALVRPSSVTHSFNVDQRWVGLVFAPEGGKRYRVHAPPTADIAPPGWYMLTALDEHGCPSAGHWIRIH